MRVEWGILHQQYKAFVVYHLQSLALLYHHESCIVYIYKTIKNKQIHNLLVLSTHIIFLFSIQRKFITWLSLIINQYYSTINQSPPGIASLFTENLYFHYQFHGRIVYQNMKHVPKSVCYAFILTL